MYTTPKSHFCLRRDYIYFQYYLININYLSLIVIPLYIIEVKFIFILFSSPLRPLTHKINKKCFYKGQNKHFYVLVRRRTKYFYTPSPYVH